MTDSASVSIHVEAPPSEVWAALTMPDLRGSIPPLGQGSSER